MDWQVTPPRIRHNSLFICVHVNAQPFPSMRQTQLRYQSENLVSILNETSRDPGPFLTIIIWLYLVVPELPLRSVIYSSLGNI